MHTFLSVPYCYSMTTTHHPEDVRIGATIREMRTMRGLTQEGLSQAAMLSRAYVANIEAGRKRPSLRAVARIAEVLHVPQVAIIADDEAKAVA